MTIILRYYDHKAGTFTTDFTKTHLHYFTGKTATECMNKIKEFRKHHDLAKYTPTEIIDVKD